ncbi:hypothetical protein FA95DRAFT_1678615 [Auriscalpium vulgare]|uniref:Uncharacterized protein n=1 Tax=Auriscalpium vulgare TaxID=40419 RepID=A0ACB8RVC8_9AGAM|nr:hypothetical protein FA95DRAFT_1678615 [Auriscalpium vulgare]
MASFNSTAQGSSNHTRRQSGSMQPLYGVFNSEMTILETTFASGPSSNPPSVAWPPAPDVQASSFASVPQHAFAQGGQLTFVPPPTAALPATYVYHARNTPTAYMPTQSYPTPLAPAPAAMPQAPAEHSQNILPPAAPSRVVRALPARYPRDVAATAATAAHSFPHAAPVDHSHAGPNSLSMAATSSSAVGAPAVVAVQKRRRSEEQQTVGDVQVRDLLAKIPRHIHDALDIASCNAKKDFFSHHNLMSLPLAVQREIRVCVCPAYLDPLCNQRGGRPDTVKQHQDRCEGRIERGLNVGDCLILSIPELAMNLHEAGKLWMRPDDSRVKNIAALLWSSNKHVALQDPVPKPRDSPLSTQPSVSSANFAPALASYAPAVASSSQAAAPSVPHHTLTSNTRAVAPRQPLVDTQASTSVQHDTQWNSTQAAEFTHRQPHIPSAPPVVHLYGDRYFVPPSPSDAGYPDFPSPDDGNAQDLWDQAPVAEGQPSFSPPLPTDAAGAAAADHAIVASVPASEEMVAFVEAPPQDVGYVVPGQGHAATEHGFELGPDFASGSANTLHLQPPAAEGQPSFSPPLPTDLMAHMPADLKQAFKELCARKDGLPTLPPPPPPRHRSIHGGC